MKHGVHLTKAGQTRGRKMNLFIKKSWVCKTDFETGCANVEIRLRLQGLDSSGIDCANADGNGFAGVAHCSGRWAAKVAAHRPIFSQRETHEPDGVSQNTMAPVKKWQRPEYGCPGTESRLGWWRTSLGLVESDGLVHNEFSPLFHLVVNPGDVFTQDAHADQLDAAHEENQNDDGGIARGNGKPSSLMTV